MLISIKNLKLIELKKFLNSKFIESLEVDEALGPNYYRLRLPKSWGIYNVINVSRLEPY